LSGGGFARHPARFGRRGPPRGCGPASGTAYSRLIPPQAPTTAHLVDDEQLEAVRAALAPSFRVESEIGRGGMATVYLAQDLKHGRRVAVKVLKPELGSSIGADRFLREIAIASRLHHPHIVPLHDSGAARDLLYYVMPYVEGETLRERLTREKQLPIAEAVGIAREVGDALSAAHAEGVIHRDIKPENILLEGGHAVVADFGLARAIAQAAGESLTSSGIVAGTPAYMSPEQSAGETELDARTDVYSLACVLYEMLTGEAPYTGTSAQAIVAKHMSQPVPSARVVRATVPPAVDAAIQRGLAKVPADRFATAREFADALAQPHERRRRSRRRWLVVVALLLAGGGAAAAFLGPLRPGRGEAGGAAAADQAIVHVGVLPVARPDGSADSARTQLIQYLFVSELARYRGLAVVDPFSLNGRLGASASQAGADPMSQLRRWGLQYAVRLTATAGRKGLDLAWVLTDAKEGSIVSAGAFTDSDQADLPAEVRQAGGRIVSALEAATGGIAKELDVAPFLARAPRPAAVSAFLQGIEYTYRGLPGGAEHFRRAAELDHDFIAPRVFLVSGLTEARDTAAARAQVLVLDSLKPKATAFEQALIGWSEAVVRGDWDAKIRHLRVGLGYSPRNNFLLFNLAYGLWITGRAQEAVAPAREALESGWRYSPLYTLWGVLAIETGAFAGLRDTLEAARSIAPPDPYVTGLLEALAFYQADPSAARRYGDAFRAEVGSDARVLQAYGEMARVYVSLAQRARENGRLPVAVSLLQRAVDVGPRQPMLLLELARVLAESGSRRDAEADYRAVADSELVTPEALSLAGDVAERLGRTADARRYFTRYLEVAPEGPDAVRVRERLRVPGRPSGPP